MRKERSLQPSVCFKNSLTYVEGGSSPAFLLRNSTHGCTLLRLVQTITRAAKHRHTVTLIHLSRKQKLLIIVISPPLAFVMAKAPVLGPNSLGCIHRTLFWYSGWFLIPPAGRWKKIRASKSFLIA